MGVNSNKTVGSKTETRITTSVNCLKTVLTQDIILSLDVTGFRDDEAAYFFWLFFSFFDFLQVSFSLVFCIGLSHWTNSCYLPRPKESSSVTVDMWWIRYWVAELELAQLTSVDAVDAVADRVGSLDHDSTDIQVGTADCCRETCQRRRRLRRSIRIGQHFSL